MQQVIKLEKEDIITRPWGLNISIASNPVEIVFSPEAAIEFAQDVMGLVIESDGKWVLREDWKEYIEECLSSQDHN